MRTSALLCGLVLSCGGAGGGAGPAGGPREHTLVMTAAFEPPAEVAALVKGRLTFLGGRNVEVVLQGNDVVAQWNKGLPAEQALTRVQVVGEFQVLAVAIDEQKALLKKFVNPEVGKTLPAGVECRHIGAGQLLVPSLVADDPALLPQVLPEPPAGTRWLSAQSLDQPPQWSAYLVRAQPIVSALDVTDGRMGIGPAGKPGMWLALSTAGQDRLRAATRSLVGKLVCMVVDGSVWSCPLVTEPLSASELMLTPPAFISRPETLLPALVHGPLPVRLLPAANQGS